MKLTSKVPTEPGIYINSHLPQIDQLWLGNVIVIDQSGYTDVGSFPHEIEGYWCRLVPADEVETAFKEGFVFGESKSYEPDAAFDKSGSKLVTEGKA